MDMGLGGLRELVMDRESWHAGVHRVAKSRTRLSDFHYEVFGFIPRPDSCSLTPEKLYSAKGQKRMKWLVGSSYLMDMS